MEFSREDELASVDAAHSTCVTYDSEITGDSSNAEIKVEQQSELKDPAVSEDAEGRMSGGRDGQEIRVDTVEVDVDSSSSALPDSALAIESSNVEEEMEEDDDREPLSYELQQGFRILREIMSDANKSVNWPFMNPVDAESLGLYDYEERIKKPMWLKKMMVKFNQREYQTITDFVADMRLMLENCYRYNGPDHYISKRGQRLETVLEQKLALLSRELREKTSIAATSGETSGDMGFADHYRFLSLGTRRRKALVPHDSTKLLNQLRLEEKEREKETRRQQILERKQQQEAYLQELQDWEDKLFGAQQEQMTSMWEIPQIGHFLFLCTGVLNLGEVMHFELERCFFMPRESHTMQLIMTSLLSTPYQRTRLDRKPAMPYQVWEEKLRVRLRSWYRLLKDNNKDIKKVMDKMGLEEQFFKVLGMKNPLEKKKYHELTLYQRVWIMKGLCDFCLETQESIREAIEAQPLYDQHEYQLGSDAEGNHYLHFPQFCGADLRIYRQAPIQMPKFERPKKEDKPAERYLSPTKRKGRPTSKKKKVPTATLR